MFVCAYSGDQGTHEIDLATALKKIPPQFFSADPRGIANYRQKQARLRLLFQRVDGRFLARINNRLRAGALYGLIFQPASNWNGKSAD